MNGKWFTFRNKKKSSSIPTINHSTDISGNDFFPEGFFHDMLHIERKRAERSKKPFMLLLMDVRSVAKAAAKKTKLHKLCGVVNASSRSIDIKGWYENQRVMGIIYTEITPAAKTLIIEKIRKNLKQTFSESEASCVELTSIFFPQSNGSTDHEAIERFYPELLDKTISTALPLAAKRTFDIVGSLLGIGLALPFFIAISALVKATSKGPIFYKQQRIGQGGKKFTFLKFRSMYVNNDPSAHMHYVKSLIRGNAGADPDSSNPGQTTKILKLVNDPLITPLGRFFRKTSIDELPQFFNVLFGNMSLVGPRPAIPYEVSEYEPWHLERVFPIKPGITGLWQVGGRSHISFDEMVRLDINYIRNWSLWLDIKLLCKTPFSVLASKDAY
jgi:lipopolysaccharide/colanic/teichoic acid biosynthesis glycosyltransferase